MLELQKHTSGICSFGSDLQAPGATLQKHRKDLVSEAAQHILVTLTWPHGESL